MEPNDLNYQETIQYLYDKLPVFQKIGKRALKPKLTNIIKLCKMLGNPQDKFPCIHIAGTNGKGSSSHFLASILQEQGYRVGLYTSPHLKDLRERFKINGEPVEEEAVTNFVRIHYSKISEIQPSFFEITVAMAFQFFLDKKVDIAVIEVGLGGRFDSTNIISKIASLITNIGFDHTEILGDTLAKIAYEKAGIIQERTPVIISEYNIETAPVFIEEAHLKDSEIIFAYSKYEILNQIQSIDRLFLEVRNNDSHRFFKIESGLVGEYQKTNIIGVLALVERLTEIGVCVSEDSILKGFKNVIRNTGLYGRWQILMQKPLVICDTGHNTHAFEITSKKLYDFKNGKVHLILGFVREKKPEQILELLPQNANFYFSTFGSFRAMKTMEIEAIASKLGISNFQSFQNVNQALDYVLKIANEEDLIFIGGSTYLVAEIKNLDNFEQTKIKSVQA